MAIANLRSQKANGHKVEMWVAMYCGRLPTFQSILLPPCSGNTTACRCVFYFLQEASLYFRFHCCPL